MSRRTTQIFQLNIIAAAILSVSACTVTPNVGGVDLGEMASSVGKGISKAGSKTAEIGSAAWGSTKRVLNIGPQDELLDEVDLALMEEDAEVQVTPVQIAVAPAAQAIDSTLPAEDPNRAQTVASNDVMIDKSDTFAQSGDTVAKLDWTHEVKTSETLWDIAKLTTGDANNWHVLADVNNLAPDASVYPGMKLNIPADMVKPDLNRDNAAEQIDIAMANTDAATDSSENQPVRLKLPAPTQVAATEGETAIVVPMEITQEESVAKTDLAKPAAATETVAASIASEEIKPAEKSEALLASITADADAMKVREGETLWDFAKRTTGDAKNWKMLADKNQFTEKDTKGLRPGRTIYVPTAMVVERDADGNLIAVAEDTTLPADKEDSVDATTAVLAGTNQPVKEGDIKIVEAAFQEDSAVNPVTAEQLSDEAVATLEKTESEAHGTVMVSGTYYPKAVYNSADFSSSLLMRVSPGTQLEVSKAIGPWLEVQTDKGIGYVHSRDVK